MHYLLLDMCLMRYDQKLNSQIYYRKSLFNAKLPLDWKCPILKQIWMDSRWDLKSCIKTSRSAPWILREGQETSKPNLCLPHNFGTLKGYNLVYDLENKSYNIKWDNVSWTFRNRKKWSRSALFNFSMVMRETTKKSGFPT